MMWRQITTNIRATTSIEFAILAPILLAFILGGLGAGIALWYYNLLVEVAGESARCLAINTSCTTTTTTACSDGTPACYVVNLATERGLSSITTSNVTVNAAATVNAISVTTVQISYPVSLPGFQTTLTCTASFPNNS